MAYPTPTAKQQLLLSTAKNLCSIRDFCPLRSADFSNFEFFEHKVTFSSCAKLSQFCAWLRQPIPVGAHKNECEKLLFDFLRCADGKTILYPTSHNARDQGDCHKMCQPSGGDSPRKGFFKGLIFRKNPWRYTEFRAEFPAPKSDFQNHDAGAKKTPRTQGKTQTPAEEEDLDMTT